MPPQGCAPNLGCTACDPNRGRYCVGSDVFTCNPDGTQGDLVAQCPGGLKACQDGQCGQPNPDNCRFVDILFVIDNSGSMGDEQEALALVWPDFVDAMYTRLPANIDLHVGVTTTSFFTGGCLEVISNCVTTATPAEIEAHFIRPTDGNTGVNGEQGRLFSYQGMSYFSANTSDTNTSALKSWFSGAAVAAGETGCSFEMPSAAAGYAAHPANSGTNAGFFRDEDGVLLIIVLSDEPDKSLDGVAAYRDMLLATKNICGGDQCIVTAGLINPCILGVNNTLWEFLNAFGEPPIWGDIGDPLNYTNTVGDALAQVVHQTCNDIVVQ